jgi:hypothetical protein
VAGENTRTRLPIVEIQRVEHESRVHIDIETDDIPAEVARLEKLGAKVANRLQRWVVMEAPTGQRLRRACPAPGFRQKRQSLGLTVSGR